MDDIKKATREADETAKETWRKQDGEDLADKVGNAGDDIREAARDAGREVEDATER